MRLFPIALGGMDRTNGQAFPASGLAGLRVASLLSAGVPLAISVTGQAGERFPLHLGDIIWTAAGEFWLFHGPIPGGAGRLVLQGFASSDWAEGVGTDADGMPFHTMRPGVVSTVFAAAAGLYNIGGVALPKGVGVRAVVVRRIRVQNTSAAAAQFWIVRCSSIIATGSAPRALDFSRPGDATDMRAQGVLLQQGAQPANAVYLDGASLAAGETGWWDVPVQLVPGTALVVAAQTLNIPSNFAMYFDEYGD